MLVLWTALPFLQTSSRHECSLLILVGTTAPCVPLLTTPLIAVQVLVQRQVTLQIDKLNYSSPLSLSPMRDGGRRPHSLSIPISVGRQSM